MSIGPSNARPPRRRVVQLLAGAVVLAGGTISASAAAAAGATAGSGPVAAAPAAAMAVAAAPATTTAGTATLTVDPATSPSAAGGAISVSGRGFSTRAGLYVAVCAANGRAPASLSDCVGGPIPSGNTSASWAHIGPTTASTGGGPVVRPWSAGGSFSVSLVLPRAGATADALDCSTVACAVYTTSDDSQAPGQRLSVPLSSRAAPGSSTTSRTTTPASTSARTTRATPTTTPASTTPTRTTPTTSTPATRTSTTPTTPTTEPTTAPSDTAASDTAASDTASSDAPVQESTSVLAAPPSTVQAVTIRSPSVAAGGEQEVVFGGFGPSEAVTVRLYSAPQTLPAARADANGIVKIDFTVPRNLGAGTHILRVDGVTSKVTGIATFVVTAPPAGSTSVGSGSADPTSSAVSSALVPPASTDSPGSTAAAAPNPGTAASTGAATAAATVGSAAAGGSRPVWPWFVLGLVLLLWAGLGVWLVQRRRSARIAAEQREQERLLAFAAAADQQRAARAIAEANPGVPGYQLPAGSPGGHPYGATTVLGGSTPASAAGSTGYPGYRPGEHELLSGRDHPDNPGMLSGRDGPGERGMLTGRDGPGDPGMLSGRDGPGDPGMPVGGHSAGGGADPDGGPPTGAWFPVFTPAPDEPTDPLVPGSAANAPRDERPVAGDPADQPADQDEPPDGGRHIR